MTERVRIAIEGLEKEYKGTAHTIEEWNEIIKNADICLSTFGKYVKLHYMESWEGGYTIEELAEFLNDCEGWCYGWNLKVVNGKAYDVVALYKWE